MKRKPEPIRPFRDKVSDAPQALGALLNLGPKSSVWLHAAGIRSHDEIIKLGPIEVCRRIRANGNPVSVVMAYALEGAISGCHWNAIPWETKQWLRAEFAKMKRAENKKP
ncbi:MAG: TfoX/Sxy family protein [Opitutaceae bacterium]